MKIVEFEGVLSIDNKTCSSVIYSNYLVSYANELSVALTNSIWEHSRCSSCLEIVWDFEKMNSTIAYDVKTIKFESVLNSWRNCVTNYSLSTDQKNSTICVECGKEFDSLFDYYWKIYTSPGVDFCIDVVENNNERYMALCTVFGLVLMIRGMSTDIMINDSGFEENVDQLSQYRERCAEHAAKFKEILEECNERVNSKKQTLETCQQR
uniref:Ubiquinol-cytochrome C reductase hinge domain-containing protein n=1 Tax=Ditylenchus dipsaci TaxID=166011 RepID=A0A915EA45_9BILA